MGKRLSLPGARDVRATLDGDREYESVVVACPPHPQFGGNRQDSRLRAVADELTERGVACLRFDYGQWDDGRGERRDVRTALGWARKRYDRVGLFGFSFGGTMAILAATPADDEPTPDVLSVLAPAAQVADDELVSALGTIDCPVQVVYGERDDTAEWEPIVQRARNLGYTVESVSADHFFVGQEKAVADFVSSFLVRHLET